MKMIPEVGDQYRAREHDAMGTIRSVKQTTYGTYSCDVEEPSGKKYNVELRPRFISHSTVTDFEVAAAGGSWRNS